MSNFKQLSSDTNVHFSNAMFGQVERSRMTANPVHLTAFNAGDIVPIYCREVLPQEDLSIDLDFVIRQTTLLTPTMGSMKVDFYAFFVPNRVVNQSWKAVQGENYNGSWTANNVSLVPLAGARTPQTVKVPIGSVADYYGFPTQGLLSRDLLAKCNDLKFRGYVMIWNEFFRDQNYQPPIPMSTLNVYQGFFDKDNGLSYIPLDPNSTTANGSLNLNFDGSGRDSDGSAGEGAVEYALYGSGAGNGNSTVSAKSRAVGNLFFATDKPLKANKLHDYFTSVLPSPQKSNQQIFVPVSGQVGNIPVSTNNVPTVSGARAPLLWNSTNGGNLQNTVPELLVVTSTASTPSNGTTFMENSGASGDVPSIYPSNLQTDVASVQGLEVSLDDIRMSSAIQQVYETLARGGSRYRELVQSFFGIEVDDPYSDIPTCLGHISRDLDLYQTAQTSASSEGSTPQGNLTAFGYTQSGGHLFNRKFIEHGYVHIFAIVRHRNIYSSYMARDNFRLNMLDFYLPPLANISEQPVYCYQINPFSASWDKPIGYQEAWAEYRYEPDMVSGLMRPGAPDSESLSPWSYADDFDANFDIVTGDWLKSNSEEVLNRTLAVTSSVAPQLKGQFRFIVDKTLPMPTYSIPGMDII